MVIPQGKEPKILFLELIIYPTDIIKKILEIPLCLQEYRKTRLIEEILQEQDDSTLSH